MIKKPVSFHLGMAAMLISMIFLASFSYPASAGHPSYPFTINERNVILTEPPYENEQILMVPLREMAEEMGGAVRWDQETKTATVISAAGNWQVTVDQAASKLNGESYVMDAPAELLKGKVMVPVLAISEALGFSASTDSEGKLQLNSDNAVLPIVGSYDKLEELVRPFVNEQPSTWRKLFGETAVSTQDAVSGAPEMGMESNASSDAPGSSDYSGTNVQVQGVDEGDIVKTDGRYIYQLNRSKLVITEAYPANELKVLSSTVLGKDMNPIELYIDGDIAVVVVQAWSGLSSPAPAQKHRMNTYWYANDSVKAIVYDIQDRESPVVLREVELEGSYVASRKIDNHFYLVANQYTSPEVILEGRAATPMYRDTTVSNEALKIGYDEISYFPHIEQPNYLHIAGFAVNDTNEAQLSTYLGAGDQIYASRDNLYITKTKYEVLNKETGKEAAGDSADMASTAVAAPDRIGIDPMPFPIVQNRSSLLYKFQLREGKATFVSEGAVPGTPLNQFAMDEHNGYFRIATTTGDMWRSDELTSKNHVYILDDQLNIVGQVEDIAPGEQIYSVRFMGDRGYMVTFRTVDPLFALDLSEPNDPKLLGALKIPGYSNYLHPYDENHLIGFGKDAVEVVHKDANGRPIGQPTAFYQGMKLSLFDVSDIHNPVEKFTEEIGDRGTDSELLYNHRALLFSKEKNLLAFPVTVHEFKGAAQTDPSQYGEFAFQGAYVYSVDPEQGFSKQGEITHLRQEDIMKSGSYWYGANDRSIYRLLYIDNVLYTLSAGEIHAHDIDNLERIGSVELPNEKTSIEAFQG